MTPTYARTRQPFFARLLAGLVALLRKALAWPLGRCMDGRHVNDRTPISARLYPDRRRADALAALVVWKRKEETMRRDRLLWTVGALAAAGTAYALCLRPWHLRWGATKEEAEEPLPGDDLTRHARGQATHAVTIHAPVSAVWPWLVQIGQDKGGFYSYTWLENLVGCHMRNAASILPEFQHLQASDKLWLHPNAPPLPVVLVEPERALVFGSNTSEPGTWGFYLKPLDGHATRLIARGRGDWEPGPLRWAYQHLLFEPAHFIMERKMLLTVKHLAEQTEHASALPSERASIHPKASK